jgi:UDP-glucose 4-epimerase
MSSVLITGASGYLGRLVVTALANGEGEQRRVVATDVTLPPPGKRLPGVIYETLDVRAPGAGALMARHRVEAVVHLAAIVTPGKGADRDLLYDVDVRGTENVIEGCLQAGARQLIVTSSGAAYGYHRDNPVPLDEHDPLRGNESFAYSHHKRLVEQLLARHRDEHPELAQLVLRVGTILGRTTRNQISALFERPFVLGLSGSESPFVVIWDEDVVAVILGGLRHGWRGIYNLAGDGSLSLREMAAMMGKPYVVVPSRLVERALAVLHALGLSGIGPEQVDFLRYRPVLSNRRLKQELGFIPRKTSRQAFEIFLEARGLGPIPDNRSRA